MKIYIGIILFFYSIFICAQRQESKILSFKYNQEQEILIPAYKGDAITFDINIYQSNKEKPW